MGCCACVATSVPQLPIVCSPAWRSASLTVPFAGAATKAASASSSSRGGDPSSRSRSALAYEVSTWSPSLMLSGLSELTEDRETEVCNVDAAPGATRASHITSSPGPPSSASPSPEASPRARNAASDNDASPKLASSSSTDPRAAREEAWLDDCDDSPPDSPKSRSTSIAAAESPVGASEEGIDDAEPRLDRCTTAGEIWVRPDDASRRAESSRDDRRRDPRYASAEGFE
mmetsp:Transcript_8536/g.21964  ORF Transcript_8536/g.21964 Transcript_8536/m.21964 type:complete len:230 (-) Transcript_8536:1261-1950(-)